MSETIYSHYDPSSIVGGDFPLKGRKVTVASGQNVAGSPLARGTVLGQRTPTATASYAAKAGNTGNTGNATLAFASPAGLATSKAGVYSVVFSGATTFSVFDPNGNDLGTGVNGTAFADQIAFTTTAGGTPMVAGDTLLVTVVQPVFAISSSVGGSNIGNGSLSLASPTNLAYAQAGAYSISFTSASNFNVADPFGNPVGSGVVGTPFAEQIGFTLSAGATPFVANNDTFTVGLTTDVLYAVSVATAADGSQVPRCILADGFVDTSAGSAPGLAYFTGEFAGEELTFDPSWTIGSLNQAFIAGGRSIFVRSLGAGA
jgi:hypothetical protein